MNLFWNKVKRRGKKQCWDWLAYRNPGGYGMFWYKKRLQLAHRVSWQIHKGSIPKGLCVLHVCDNPSCVNPEHLWLGTRIDNNNDKVRKGRAQHMFGEENGRARFTKEQVLELRQLWHAGATLSELAGRFARPAASIHHAVSGYTWSHL